MPTYEYACTSCGEQLEAVQRFSDDPLTVCPACGGTLRKVFSPVGIVFKGSGFYRTDSRNGAITGGDKSADKDQGDKSKDTAKANGSGDSSSSDKKSSDSGSKKPDTAKANGSKPAQTASAGSSS